VSEPTDEEEYGPLTDAHRALLDLLLREEFPGAAELRAQVAFARSWQNGDDFIEFRVDRAASPAPVTAHVPVEAHYGEGAVVEIWLWVGDDGYLSSIETMYAVPRELFSREPALDAFVVKPRVWVLH
jgi:hypothetical protein